MPDNDNRSFYCKWTFVRQQRVYSWEELLNIDKKIGVCTTKNINETKVFEGEEYTCFLAEEIYIGPEWISSKNVLIYLDSLY